MIIVFWDISNFSALIKELKALLKKRIRKITNNNNTFRTKKIKIPEDKKSKTYEYVKYVHELIVKK